MKHFPIWQRASIASLSIFFPAAIAAPITWSTQPTTIISESDISLAGTLVEAITWGGPAQTLTLDTQTIVFENARISATSPPDPANDNVIVTAVDENGNADYFLAPGAIDL